jgi:beta-fructofuranosidase
LNQTEWEGDGNLVVDYSSVASNALFIDVNVTGLNASAMTSYSTFNLTFTSPASGETLRSGFFFGGDQPFFVDRGGVKGFDNVFLTDKMSVADVWNSTSGTWRFQAMVDRSMYEAFVDGGIHTGTVLFYPNEPLTSLSLNSTEMPAGSKVSVAVWGLKSAWAEYEDETGMVYGNVTTANTTAVGKRHMAYEASF